VGIVPKNATTPPYLVRQKVNRSYKINTETAVVIATSRHRVHQTAPIFMPDGIIGFEGKVIFRAKPRRDGNHSVRGKIDTLMVAIRISPGYCHHSPVGFGGMGDRRVAGGTEATN